jgi:hypothetical protein
MPIRIIIISLLLFISFSSNAEYQPAMSYETYIETLTVNKDASVVQIIEGVSLIETQRGVEEEGQQSFIFNSKLEKAQILEAYTLQPDGRKIKVPKTGIRVQDDSASGSAPMFTETKRMVIIYPEVKIGSKLYYKFKSFQHTPEFKGQFFTSHFFSPHYRFKNFVVDFRIHKDLPIQFDTKGMSGGLVDQQNQFNHYEYKFNQSKVLPVEPEQVDSEDFAPYFTASTFKDQIDLGKAYQKGLEGKTVVTPSIQNLADRLTEGLKDDPSRAKALHNWVSQNIRYVAVYLGNGGVVPHDAETILKNLYGDCKDHAVLLEALLKAKGIASSHALINSGNAFSLPKLAVMRPQNHVINYIPSLDIYLDSTAQFAPYGSLPVSDMDKPVILTALNKIGHTPRMSSKESLISNNVDITINEDGTMKGVSNSTAKGSSEVDYRSIRANNKDLDELYVVKRRLASANESGFGEIKTTDPLDLSKPFSEKTSFTLDATSNFPGPGAMQVPQGLSFNLLFKISKLKPLEKLNFPSVCYGSTIEDRYIVTFPKNIKITRIPENTNFQTSNLKYKSSYKKERNKIYILKHYEESHPKGVCGNDENEQHKALYKVMQRDFRSQIFYE